MIMLISNFMFLQIKPNLIFVERDFHTMVVNRLNIFFQFKKKLKRRRE